MSIVIVNLNKKDGLVITMGDKTVIVKLSHSETKGNIRLCVDAPLEVNITRLNRKVLENDRGNCVDNNLQLA